VAKSCRPRTHRPSLPAAAAAPNDGAEAKAETEVVTVCDVQRPTVTYPSARRHRVSAMFLPVTGPPDDIGNDSCLDLPGT
jgi:hypothetical protein